MGSPGEGVSSKEARRGGYRPYEIVAATELTSSQMRGVMSLILKEGLALPESAQHDRPRIQTACVGDVLAR